MNNLPTPGWERRSFTRHEPMPVEPVPLWFKWFVAVTLIAVTLANAWVGMR